jgi:hypothetical protein
VSTRNVKDVIIAGWEGALVDELKRPSTVHALALKLAAIAESHGAALSRPAHLHDPVATDWQADAHRPPPGDQQAGARAAWDAFQAARAARCDTSTETTTEHAGREDPWAE